MWNVRVAGTVVLYDSKNYQSISGRESRTVLAITLLLICWGLAAVAVGLIAFFVAVLLDEAWRKISLAVERKDD
jgi:hypothetical protein